MTQYGGKHLSNRKKVGFRQKSQKVINRRRRKGKRKVIKV